MQKNLVMMPQQQLGTSMQIIPQQIDENEQHDEKYPTQNHNSLPTPTPSPTNQQYPTRFQFGDTLSFGDSYDDQIENEESALKRNLCFLKIVRRQIAFLRRQTISQCIANGLREWAATNEGQ